MSTPSIAPSATQLLSSSSLLSSPSVSDSSEWSEVSSSESSVSVEQQCEISSLQRLIDHSGSSIKSSEAAGTIISDSESSVSKEAESSESVVAKNQPSDAVIDIESELAGLFFKQQLVIDAIVHIGYLQSPAVMSSVKAKLEHLSRMIKDTDGIDTVVDVGTTVEGAGILGELMKMSRDIDLLPTEWVPAAGGLYFSERESARTQFNTIVARIVGSIEKQIDTISDDEIVACCEDIAASSSPASVDSDALMHQFLSALLPCPATSSLHFNSVLIAFAGAGRFDCATEMLTNHAEWRSYAMTVNTRAISDAAEEMSVPMIVERKQKKSDPNVDHHYVTLATELERIDTNIRERVIPLMKRFFTQHQIEMPQEEDERERENKLFQLTMEYVDSRGRPTDKMRAVIERAKLKSVKEEEDAVKEEENQQQ